MNRREFLGYIGCGCCTLVLPSCTTAPQHLLPNNCHQTVPFVFVAFPGKRAAGSGESCDQPSHPYLKDCMAHVAIHTIMRENLV